MAGNGSASGPAKKPRNPSPSPPAPDRAVMPEQTVSRSSTRVSAPRSARWKAMEQPITPPPTTTTLAPAAMPVSLRDARR